MSVRDFDEKIRQKETLKTPKKLIALLTTASFIIKVNQIVLFNGFPWLNFIEKTHVIHMFYIENGLSNCCTKTQVIPMVSSVNIKDLMNKNIICSEVNQITKHRYFSRQYTFTTYMC